jgi:hypothetical protein
MMVEDRMKVTASKLRENVYQLLDEVIATGTPLEVVRKGVVLRIEPEFVESKLSRLKKRGGFEGNSDDIAGMDWSSEWNEVK